jgi:acetyl esterase/lipase
VRNVTVSESPRWAIGRSDRLYRGDMSQAGGRADYLRIDLWTGERAPMLFALRQSMGSSPDGRWLLYMLDGHVHARDVATGKTTDLSEQAGVDFVNYAADRPSEKPSYGIAGWPSSGDSVLLNHEFDIWQVPLDSTTGNGNATAVNLTHGVGSEQKIRFRLVQLDAQEDTFDMSGSLVLSAYGEWTKESGYWGLEPGQAPRPALFEAAMIGGLRRAEKWDRLLYTRQTFVDFPDYWVADTGMQNARKITDANPQQSDYRWSPGRVLIDYVDGRGNELQATLTLPAGYEAGERYPMLVYFYEKMSQRHHQYSMPTYDDRPHMSTYASDGYLVLMPDIVYSDGKPGSSSLDDVTAAVNKVISLGYADPEHIGLQGHSWGGYESSYVVTQTDMFACVVTGAPLTNLVSMHNILYKRSGNPNAPLIEWGQGRMAANPWSDLKSYQEQSPVHNAEGITTPFMILHGTEDGAVDWNQGLEFYIAARRLGKEVILLSYPGEPHHLGKVENQKDFQIRMKSYFDHYLKGRPAPAWMVEGVPFLDKGREKPDGKSGG